MLQILSKSKTKYLRSLKLSKFRQMYNNFIVEGEKIALELLAQTNIEIENIVCTQEWIDKQGGIERDFGDKILIAKPKDMDQITALKTATEVLVVAKQINSEPDAEKISQDLSLFLDTIQNPGNFGTILRIADWFGISTVFCSPDSVDLYNPKVIQATMGAFLRVAVIKTDFSALKETYPDLPVYGTVLEGENLFKTSLESKGIIVIGSEGKGISAATKEYVSHPITIPAHPDGGAESLNAAVATGIVCAAFRNN